MAKSKSNKSPKTKRGKSKRKGGQPTKYKPEYATDEFLDKYVQHCKDNEELVSLCGLSVYLKVCEDTIQNWRKSHPEFFVPLRRIMQISKQMLINKGLVGDYNSVMAKMMLSANHGMHETQKQENETVQRIIMGKKKRDRSN